MALKEDIQAATAAFNAAKRDHGQDSSQANAARLALTEALKQAREAAQK